MLAKYVASGFHMTRTPSPSHDPLHKKSRNCESTNTESECPRSVAAGHQVSFSHKITESSADLDAYHFQWQGWVNVVTDTHAHADTTHVPSRPTYPVATYASSTASAPTRWECRSRVATTVQPDSMSCSSREASAPAVKRVTFAKQSADPEMSSPPPPCWGGPHHARLRTASECSCTARRQYQPDSPALWHHSLTTPSCPPENTESALLPAPNVSAQTAVG